MNDEPIKKALRRREGIVGFLIGNPWGMATSALQRQVTCPYCYQQVHAPKGTRNGAVVQCVCGKPFIFVRYK